MKRAIVIGLNYTGQAYALPDCELDADNMAAILKGAGVQVSLFKGEISAGFLISHLTNVEATRQKSGDTLFLYYSGHGTQLPNMTEADGEDEALCLYEKGKGIEALRDNDLRAALDKIPGSKIMILDSCFSGGMDRNAPLPGRYRKSVQFDPASMTRFLMPDIPARSTTKPKLYCLFACAESEVSYSTGIGGMFTNSLRVAHQQGKRKIKDVMKVAEVKCEPDQTPNVFIVGGAVSKRIW